ncbi:MAG: HlyD family efflux transporter periplasmic adaptor subunit [Deltaproteobacteria bacterium]|nr:HlyD family efflux transporter periplasmic adaptor subunit [Deltaproteobacteria bacterium]
MKKFFQGFGRTDLDADDFLPAARLVPVPRAPRRVGRRMAIAMVGLLFFGALAPWRQNLGGEGQVIAFTPDDRPQVIQATISGRILRWHVLEGEKVEEGELLVELVDNDPNRMERLETQRQATEARLSAYEDAVSANEDRVRSLREAQTAKVEAAQAKIRVARQKLSAAEQKVEAARAAQVIAVTQRDRIATLQRDGLSSTRDREVAERDHAKAEADLRVAEAEVRAARDELAMERANLEEVRASTAASLESARASLRSAETNVATARSSLASIESRVAQQSAQRIVAPRAGTVQRVVVQQGGMQVSRGQTLAYLVPETESRAVALKVDGNDAALITPGRPVRLQFEGWPAVQFAGWPSVAVGTFGGKVAFVDPADDGSGDFRVVVVPDTDDEAWPSARFLRQGVRAKGWVLLEEVSVGFEIWRQLNGFPPRYNQAPANEGSYSGSTGYGGGYGDSGSEDDK